MTRDKEDEPLHSPSPGPSAGISRFVRNVEIDFILEEWFNRFIEGGKEAAGPYPFDLWRERYFQRADGEQEAIQVVITSTRRRGVFEQRIFDELAAATAERLQYIWDATLAGVYGFSAEEKTWKPDVADNGSSVDSVDGSRPAVEDGVRPDDLPSLQHLDEAGADDEDAGDGDV